MLTHRSVIHASMVFCALLSIAMVPAVADVDFTNENGIEIGSKSSGTFLRIGGRLHVDAAKFDDEVTSLDDDVILRRARIALAGRYHDDWRLALDYDLGEVSGFKNAWIRYAGFNNTYITLGNQVAPFSLEERTSSNNITLMERSLSNAFSPGFLMGATVRIYGKKWTATGGVYGDELNDRQRRKGDGTSVAARVTYTPVRNKRHLLHLGVSSEYRNLGNNEVRFRSRPESFATKQKLIDTRTIVNADDLATLGLEAAWRGGPFSMQGEYVRTAVSRSNAKSLNFDGGYVLASYFLTHTRRGYRRTSGSFGNIAGNEQNAWEVAARYSNVNLNDDDIFGGKEENVTLGLNWYINQNFRVMLNYVAVDLSPNKNGIDESPNIFQIRLQAAL